MALSTKPASPVVPVTDPNDQELKMLASYASFISLFMRYTVELGQQLQAKGGSGAIVASRASTTASRKALHFMIPSGALQTWTADADTWLLAAFDVYSNHIVTVSSDGTGQSELISGATFRPLPGMLVGSNANDATPIYNRVFIPKHSVLTISINSGPAIVVLIFEPISIAS